MGLNEETKFGKVVDMYLNKGLICSRFLPFFFRISSNTTPGTTWLTYNWSARAGGTPHGSPTPYGALFPLKTSQMSPSRGSSGGMNAQEERRSRSPSLLSVYIPNALTRARHVAPPWQLCWSNWKGPLTAFTFATKAPNASRTYWIAWVWQNQVQQRRNVVRGIL